MDFGQIISRAAQITWRYKFLWVFGIVMALCGQSSGGTPRFRMNYRLPYNPYAEGTQFPTYFPEPFGQVPMPVYLAIGISLALIFGVISIIVGSIGRGALIKAVDRVENDETIDLRKSWQDGLSHLIPLGFLHALLYLPFLIFLIIVLVIIMTQIWPLLSQLVTYQPGVDSQTPPPFVNDFSAIVFPFFTTICVTVCLAAIIQIIMAFFLTFGSRAIVLENQTVLGSLGRSWHRFRHNIGSTLILAFLIFVMVMVIGFMLAIPAMAVMFPIMLSSMPDMLSETGPSISHYLLLGTALLITTVIFCFVNGILQVFTEALWTLAYREFMEQSKSS